MTKVSNLIKKTNPWISTYQLALMDRLVVYAGKRPIGTAALLFFVFISICLAMWWHPISVDPVELSGLQLVFRKIPENFSVDTLFSGLWAIQATLIALVYPIAISFATIFIQKEQNAKATLHIYLVVSGAKFTGVCGLMSLVGLTILVAFMNIVPIITTFQWLIASVFLLLTNILLIINFLIRTFAIISSSGRRQAWFTYLVAHIWPTEAERLENLANLTQGSSKFSKLFSFIKLKLGVSEDFSIVEKFSAELSVLDCLAEIAGELHQAMEQDNYTNFKHSLKEFKDTLKTLVTVSCYTDKEGLMQNRSLISQGGVCSLRLWLDCASLPLSQAISISGVFPDFAKDLIELPCDIFQLINAKIPNEGISILMNAQQSFILKLAHSTNFNYFYKNSAFNSLDTAEANQAAVYMAATAAWEQLGTVLTHKLEASFNWNNLDYLTTVKTYMEHSVAMIAAVAGYGSSSGLTCLVDSYLRWPERLSRMTLNDFRHTENSWAVTIDAIKKDWSEVEDLVPDYIKNKKTNLQLDLINAALINYWKDCCAVLAYTAISEFLKSKPNAQNNKKVLFQAVFNRKLSVKFEDGLDSLETPFSGLDDYLLSLTRQHLIDGGYKLGYRKILDGIVEKCRTVYPDNWIQGRTSSHVFLDRLEDVEVGMAFCILVFCREGWTVDPLDFLEKLESLNILSTNTKELETLVFRNVNVLHEFSSSNFEELWKELFPSFSLDETLKVAKIEMIQLLTLIQTSLI